MLWFISNIKELKKQYADLALKLVEMQQQIDDLETRVTILEGDEPPPVP